MGLIISCLTGIRHNTGSRREIRVYRRQHRVLLLKNALPVFVAASISRAILAVILELSGGHVSSILAAFVYTFIISHSTGVALTIFLPQDMKMLHYFHHLITETVGFAWKESALLLIVDQIARRHNFFIGIGTWCAFVLFAVGFVSTSTLLCVRLKLSPAVERAVASYTSEVFALSIAYTFTIIIAYMVYWQQRDDSSVYGADDDVDSEGDDDTQRSNTTALSHGLFLFYAIALSYIIAVISSYNEDTYAETERGTCNSIASGVSFSRDTAGSMPDAAAMLESHNYNADDIDVNRTGDNKDTLEDRNRDGSIDGGVESELSNRDGAYTSSGVVMARYITWDEYFHIHSALFNLVQTIEGYMVGSAWFLWITFTFDVFFSFTSYLTIFGYTLFAVLMTYTMARVMSLSRFKLDHLTDTCDKSSKTFVRRRKRQQLKMAASRITVGWIWESVVAEAFIEIAGIGSHEITNTIKLLVKCGVALLLFIIGALVQYYIFEHIADDTDTHSTEDTDDRHDPNNAIPTNDLHAPLLDSSDNSAVPS